MASIHNADPPVTRPFIERPDVRTVQCEHVVHPGRAHHRRCLHPWMTGDLRHGRDFR